MDIEKDIHLPTGLILVGIQHFPFKNRNVLNFFIQGITVFIVAAIVGFEAGHIVNALCH
jgi:hypothetical protein